MDQDYDLQVFPSYALLGNTAVMKCLMPAFVSEFLVVDSWLWGTETIRSVDTFLNFPPFSDRTNFKTNQKLKWSIQTDQKFDTPLVNVWFDSNMGSISGPTSARTTAVTQSSPAASSTSATSRRATPRSPSAAWRGTG